ncbi:MAG: AAA family ATPase [Arenicellales bacterium]
MSSDIINALCRSGAFFDQGEVEIVETHISWVVLAGEYAYKFKKPVDLGFVNFTSIERRAYYCEEEIRLNRRLAPDLYVGVVKITGPLESPELEGPGEVLDYAVKMSRFPADRELSHMIKTRLPPPEAFYQLATDLAVFHDSVAIADQQSSFANPDVLASVEMDNFKVINKFIHEPGLLARLQSLEAWTKTSLINLEKNFHHRKLAGRVRECHGDLHLGNLVYLNDQIIPFDCLEFNPGLRWIDVASELAFLLMDLFVNQYERIGRMMLDRYLESSGDYELVTLLQHYLVYRAMVRAKVSCLQRPGDNESNDRQGDFIRYLDFAERITAPVYGLKLIITCGFSGSGKTWISNHLVERATVIRVRSDVVRKQMHGLGLAESSESGIDSGIYTRSATQDVYQELGRLVDLILDAGYSVVVDASFLRKEHRDKFAALAEKHAVMFTILHIDAPYDVLASRIDARQQSGSDASEAGMAVVDNQRLYYDSLDSMESEHAVKIDSTLNQKQILSLLEPLVLNQD